MHFSCPFRGCQNEGPASCKANDDPEGPVSCKWSFGGAGLLQMIIRRAAAVTGGIGDSSSWMKTDFFV